MAYHFRPAKREASNLLIGIAGPTGSGKTYSGLRLATGIVQVTGGKIAVIDTERGRAKQYAPDNLGYSGFDFLHCDVEPPYSAENYKGAFEVGEEVAGEGGVVLIDSMSHEHEGDGGLLDQHDAEVKRMSGGDQRKAERVKGFAWVKPKKMRRDFVNRILQARCHVICCFRAKEKIKMMKVDNKMTIVPIGWQPITGDDWPYEMTIMCLMDDKRKGVPIIHEFDAGKLPDGLQKRFPLDKPLSEFTGKQLAEWSRAGVDAPTVSTKNDFRGARDGRQAATPENHDRSAGNGHGGRQRPSESHDDIPFDNAPVDLPGDDGPDDGQVDDHVDESVEVIFDQHDEKDRETFATAKEAAVALATRIKATSYFYASRMIALNAEWIGELDTGWQQRLEERVEERRRHEQAHG